jgi:iron complex outermembrane receptor protein
VPIGNQGVTADFSLWARNLLEEDYIFYKSANATTGVTFGVFNDPRALGLDMRVRF